MTDDPSLHVNGITLDRMTWTVTHNERQVDLTLTEFRLLERLMSCPNRVYSRDQLGVDRSVDRHIMKLRKALGHNLIRTVRGVGYAFCDRTGR